MDRNTGKKRSSAVNCCVVGCSNTYKNTEANVKFYSFPQQWFLAEQKEKWIQAIKRSSTDGSKWQPTKNSRICSKHFIGNKQSKHPNNPSFVPTIFPAIYKRTNDTTNDERFQRLVKRETSKAQQIERHCVEETPLIPSPDPGETSCTIATQVSFKNSGVTSFVFEVSIESDGVGTQAAIPYKSNLPRGFVETADKECEADTFSADGFRGFLSIENEDALKSLTGVSTKVFELLLSILSEDKIRESKITRENRLLIFLTKIKSGMSYSALAVFFYVHRTAVSKIFISVLHYLAQRMKSFVFWPGKATVMVNLPPAFRSNYSNCRAIIDCTEIKVEQPKRVDERIFMYSNYKSSFTVKVLLAITPNGMISFVSKCYEGRATDAFITTDSGFLNLVEPGDEILMDKGFPEIRSLLENKNVLVAMPPFVHDGTLTDEEVKKTYRIAKVRIHVERCIQRVKIYNILNKLPTELLPDVDDIFFMCCALTNLQLPIIGINDEDD